MSRPTVMTELTVNKLEEAFALGCSDEEACVYADICKQTLYNFQEKNQEFLDQKELLKMRPVLLARQAVVKGFENNPHLALKFLERKKRDEFDLRHDETGKDKPIPIINIISSRDYSELDEKGKRSGLFIAEAIANRFGIGV